MKYDIMDKARLSAKNKDVLSKLKQAILFSGAALLVLLSGPGEALSATQVPASRLALLARGVNADNIVNNSRIVTYDATDIAQLQAMGFTYVRIPIDPSYMLAGVPVDGQKLPSSAGRVAQALTRLDQAVATFVQAGLSVTLCIQPQSSVLKLTYPQSQDIISRSLDVVASRYATQYTPDQVFFETLNEPHYDTTTWNTFAPQLVATIRKSAPNHTIIVPPAASDIPTNFKYLNVLPDQNIVYTMHVYQPVQISSQGVIVTALPNYRFPKPIGSTDTTEWTNAKVSMYMNTGINWATQKQVPLIMNEFGSTSVADPTSRANWIKLVRLTAEKNGIGWAWWSFDGRLYGLRPQAGAFDSALVQLLSQ